MHQHAHNGTISSETPEESRLFQAVLTYFLKPTEENLHVLQQELLSPGGDSRSVALAVQAADTVLDAEIEQLGKIIAEQGGAVACRAGCAGCCHHLVPCQPFEAARIGLYITARPELHTFFENAYREWDARTKDIRDSYLAWGERYYRDGVDDGAHRLEDYYIPCLFLENALCRIYPVRPYPCRSCLSVAETCRAPLLPEDRPGMQSLDCGAYTTHKHTRKTLVDLLWQTCGMDPATVRNRPMPDLVYRFLHGGFSAALRYAVADDTW